MSESSGSSLCHELSHPCFRAANSSAYLNRARSSGRRSSVLAYFSKYLGVGMLAVSIGVAFAMGQLLGVSGNVPQMLIAGPIALACDVTYRWKHPAGHWIHPSKGGSFCLVPVWVFGTLWLVLGIAYSIT